MRLLRLVSGLGFLTGLACSGLGDVDLSNLTPVPPPDATWTGTWDGPGTHLEIAADGMVTLERSSAHSNTQWTLPARAWAADQVTVGFGPFSQTLTVQEPPHAVDGGIAMTVDGVALRRTGDVLSVPTPGAPELELPGLPPSQPPL